MSGEIGVAPMGGDAKEILARIEELERLGIPAAWLTTNWSSPDALTIFSAAAVRTQRIMLGTCITPTWPRHPLVAAQQVQVVSSLAPGRFRFGVGPSHRPTVEAAYGFNFRAPLTNLREYVHIVKTVLRDGSVDFDGQYYHAHARIPEPVPDVPVMASALQRGSFEFCGAEADGAISWVCPPPYLRSVALPAMKEGAQRAGRSVPPLIAHVPVCLHEDAAAVRGAVREQLEIYPTRPFYARMFAEAGFPEAEKLAEWSDRMIDAVVFWGSEEHIASRLRELFSWGVAEVIVSVVTVGEDPAASWGHTVSAMAHVASTMEP